MKTGFSILAFTILAITLNAGRAEAQIPAEDHAVELGVRLWRPTPGIVLANDALTGTGVEEVDFVQEFGFAEQWFPEFTLVAGRSHKFRLHYVRFNYDAETILSRTITFQGRTFTIGAPATADVQWDLWRFGYEWDFVRASRGYFGAVVELKYNQITGMVDSPVLSSAATTEPEAWVPTFGVAGRGYPHPMVSIGGEFTGFSFSLDREELDVTFWDFDINGGVHFGRHFGVFGGYRSIDADYLVDSDRGDITMKGPYVSAVVKF